MYPGRSLFQAGLTMAGSSDWPAGLISPFEGMAAAMERRTTSGREINPSEVLTAEEAVELYTAAAGHAIGASPVVGKLLPGANADLIVVDRDLVNSRPDEIRQAKVKVTMVGG